MLFCCYCSGSVLVKVAKGSIWIRKDLPTKLEVEMGDRVEFSVDVLCCDNEKVSYQWYHNGAR